MEKQYPPLVNHFLAEFDDNHGPEARSALGEPAFGRPFARRLIMGFILANPDVKGDETYAQRYVTAHKALFGTAAEVAANEADDIAALIWMADKYMSTESSEGKGKPGQSVNSLAKQAYENQMRYRRSLPVSERNKMPRISSPENLRAKFRTFLPQYQATSPAEIDASLVQKAILLAIEEMLALVGMRFYHEE